MYVITYKIIWHLGYKPKIQQVITNILGILRKTDTATVAASTAARDWYRKLDIHNVRGGTSVKMAQRTATRLQY
ncbi:hypothetical protein GF319_01840 [Candidatus Bathyarchaeota archaeon]|nr:hypothetical protein [Candidatus Bathyarchaeota archaeon]